MSGILVPLRSSLSFVLQVEEVLPGQPVLLRAGDGHDDVHDDRGPPDADGPPPQRLGRGLRPRPLLHVPGAPAAPGALRHEPALLPLLCARAGRTRSGGLLPPWSADSHTIFSPIKLYLYGA